MGYYEEYQQAETKRMEEPKQNTYARPLTERMKLKGDFDQYDIGVAYELDPMRWAAVKKITGAGTRNGGKPMGQDIDEAIESLVEFKKEFCNEH